LHLSDGVELVLKEELRREHWSLLFADVDKASESALKAGKYIRTRYDTSYRLTEITSPSPKQTAAL